MNFSAVFWLLLLLALGVPLALVVLRSPENGAKFQALALIRTTLLGVASVMVVVVVALASNGTDTAPAVVAFLLALLLAFLAFGSERYIADAYDTERAARRR